MPQLNAPVFDIFTYDFKAWLHVASGLCRFLVLQVFTVATGLRQLWLKPFWPKTKSWKVVFTTFTNFV